MREMMLLCLIASLFGTQGCSKPLTSLERQRLENQQEQARIYKNFYDKNGYAIPYGTPQTALDSYK